MPVRNNDAVLPLANLPQHHCFAVGYTCLSGIGTGPVWSPLIRLYPSNDIRRAHSARLARHFLAVLEQDERWNTLNTEPGGNILFNLSIEFRKPGRCFELCRRLLKCRRHHFAGPAPGRPEIHDDRNIIATDVFVEITPSELRWAAAEQGLATLATFRVVGDTCLWNTVDGAAIWTNDMLRICHGYLFSKR